MRFTQIHPLSQAELEAPGRYFQGASDAEADALPIEERAIRAETEKDPVFAEVAYYVFRGAYRDPPRPCPPADHVSHAAEVFRRIAPNWWRSIGLGMFS